MTWRGGKITDEERVRALHSIWGHIRFDKAAVANVLRAGPLSKLTALGLANLIEGKHPQGLRLEMKGLGRGKLTIAEGAALYERSLRINMAFMRKRYEEGCSWEEAIEYAAGEFAVSEATAARAVALLEGEESKEGE